LYSYNSNSNQTLIRNIQNHIKNIYLHPTHCYTRPHSITCFHTTLDGDLLFHIFVPEPTLVRANITRVTSPPNSTTGGSRFIFSVPFSYFLFIFYLSRCILLDLTSVSSLAIFPFYLVFITTTTTVASDRKKTISTDVFCSITLYYVYWWHSINSVKYTSHRHINVYYRVFFFA